MIWALVREQLRAQRRFVIATGVVLALALTAAAYGLFMATTSKAGAAKIDAVFGYDKEWHLYSSATVTPSPDGPDTTIAQQDAALAQAMSDGSDVIAVRNIWAEFSPFDNESVVALGGNVDWESILASGEPPASGQVVLAASIAQRDGVGVGDNWTVPLRVCDDANSCRDAPFSLAVVGIARSSFDAVGLAAYVPGVYVAWDDSTQVLTDYAGGNSSQPIYGDTTFNWNVGSTALDKLGTAGYGAGASGSTGQALTVAAFVLVGALTIGLVAMAFAVGRAQAQARSKWVATARTLGATKRQIVATNLLEAATVGLMAGAIGIAAGFALASLHLALVQRAVPHAAYPTHVIAPAWVIAVLLLLALALSGIVGAVPAFWATRVSPVAALKPVSDISEAEVSRRVSVRPLVIGWSAANVVAIAIAATGAAGVTFTLLTLAGVVIVVTTPMLMHEVLRWAIPFAGNRLSRSPRRARMMAGDALLSRPRQATIPAFIVALGLGAVVAIVVPVAAQISLDSLDDSSDGSVQTVGWFDALGVPSWAVFAAVAATAITTVVTLAIGVATATLTSREAATREALGATRTDSRWAGAIGYAAIQASGIVLGLAVGLYAGTWILWNNAAALGYASWMASLSAAVLVVTVVVAIAAIGAVVGAALSATFTPQPMTATRMEAMA